MTWALILASARNIVDEVNGFRSGHWQQTVGDTLRGKTLGLLGLGNIGSQVVRIGLAFGMEVIAWSEHLDATRAAELGVTRVDKEQLFRLEVVGEVGHVDILIANLAYPHTYAPAHEKTEADLEYACVSA